MANSTKCERCGANLDFGERCSCVGKSESENSNGDKKYYRTFPEYSEEQALAALHSIKALID